VAYWSSAANCEALKETNSHPLPLLVFEADRTKRPVFTLRRAMPWKPGLVATAVSALTAVPDGHADVLLFRLARVGAPSARALRRRVDDVLRFSR
jgi:hypothetical protein